MCLEPYFDIMFPYLRNLYVDTNGNFDDNEDEFKAP